MFQNDIIRVLFNALSWKLIYQFSKLEEGFDSEKISPTSGSVGMGSVGSKEPINIWAVGSGTHRFWAMETLNYPFYEKKPKNNYAGADQT